MKALLNLLQDVRYGARTLARNPGFAVAGIVTLALGLGANMAMFRFLDAVLLESLPVHNPRQLVRVRPFNFDYPTYQELTSLTNDVFVTTAAHFPSPVNFSIEGATEQVQAELVSGSYFAMLGVKPLMGRLLDAEDDGAEGAHPVCVISYGLWRRRFGGDPTAIGRMIHLNAEPFEIIGVTPRGFHGGDLHARYDVQIPMSMTRSITEMERDSTNWTWLTIMARLAPGVSRQEAQAAVRARFKPKREFEKAMPLSLIDGRQGMASLRIELQQPVLIAQLLSACVFLIACANLAGLLLAKTSSRRHEIAVRQSLGASRGRLMTQVLVESSLLAGAGALVGAGCAVVLDDLLTSMLSAPSSKFELAQVPSTLSVLVSFGLIILAVLAVGSIPALVSTREAPLDGLRDSPRHGLRPSWIGRGFVVAQVMACLVLVFAAGLFARSLHNLHGVDLGLTADRVVVMSTDPERSGYSRARSLEFYDEWLRRARLVPGVSSASLANIAAMSGAMFAGTVGVPDAEPRQGPEPNNNVNVVTPNYFSTVGLSLLQGRLFTDRDAPAAPRVAIVNQQFADYYWPGRSPVGRRFWLFTQTQVLEIVGVVRTAKYLTVREEPQITIYLPLAQRPLTGMTLHARVVGNIAAATAALRQAVHDIDSRVPVYNVGLLQDYIDARLSNERVLNVLSLLFASLAVIVACAGLYGVVTYATARRQREIGIRLAVGAQRRSILILFIKDIVTLVTIGLWLGIPLSIAVGRQFSSVLYGVEPSNVPTLLLAAGLLAAVAMAAAGIPAARAASVDPSVTLRHQ